MILFLSLVLAGPEAAQTTPSTLSPAELAAILDRGRSKVPIAIGATIVDQTGSTVGKVAAVDTQFVTLLIGLDKIRVPRSALDAQGARYVAKTSAGQLSAMMARRRAAAATQPR